MALDILPDIHQLETLVVPPIPRIHWHPILALGSSPLRRIKHRCALCSYDHRIFNCKIIILIHFTRHENSFRLYRLSKLLLTDFCN